MDAEDPDPGGAVVHPTPFYGLWPRFHAADAEVEEPVPAELVAGHAE